jgi:thiamine biosynthesis protein ThiS
VTIVVNGGAREIADGSTVADLLASLGREDEAMAVAVNLRVVPRARFVEHRLAPHDRVDIVTPVGGG